MNLVFFLEEPSLNSNRSTSFGHFLSAIQSQLNSFGS